VLILSLSVLNLLKLTRCQLLLQVVQSTVPAKQSLDRCLDVAVSKIFKLYCFEDCRYIRLSGQFLMLMQDIAKRTWDMRQLIFLPVISPNSHRFKNTTECIEWLVSKFCPKIGCHGNMLRAMKKDGQIYNLRPSTYHLVKKLSKLVL